jgi:hypothetical protein
VISTGLSEFQIYFSQSPEITSLVKNIFFLSFGRIHMEYENIPLGISLNQMKIRIDSKNLEISDEIKLKIDLKKCYKIFLFKAMSEQKSILI